MWAKTARALPPPRSNLLESRGDLRRLMSNVSDHPLQLGYEPESEESPKDFLEDCKEIAQVFL